MSNKIQWAIEPKFISTAGQLADYIGHGAGNLNGEFHFMRGFCACKGWNDDRSPRGAMLFAAYATVWIAAFKREKKEGMQASAGRRAANNWLNQGMNKETREKANQYLLNLRAKQND